MEQPPLLSVIAICIALGALLVSLFSYRRESRLLKNRHADAIFVNEIGAEDEINRSSGSRSGPARILVLNSGEFPVIVHQVGNLVGPEYVLNRSQPVSWQLIGPHLPWNSHLLPESHIAIEVPPPPAGGGLLGPAAIVTDSLGERWLVAEGLRRNIPIYKWRHKPHRRHLWLERNKCLRKLMEDWQENAAQRQNLHPGRVPVWPATLAWVYGWRAGPVDRSMDPMGAPLGWAYTTVRFNQTEH